MGDVPAAELQENTDSSHPMWAIVAVVLFRFWPLPAVEEPNESCFRTSLEQCASRK